MFPIKDVIICQKSLERMMMRSTVGRNRTQTNPLSEIMIYHPVLEDGCAVVFCVTVMWITALKLRRHEAILIGCEG
jgi:hypothetical protein